jgi:hypothetical protein
MVHQPMFADPVDKLVACGAHAHRGQRLARLGRTPAKSAQFAQMASSTGVCTLVAEG